MDETIGTSYTIVSQREDYRKGPDDEYAQGVIVTFQTQAGNKGSVFIPDAVYTEAEVRRQVGARAARMDAVGRIVG